MMPGDVIPTAKDLESEINRALIHFEKEYMGRGPLETKTYLLDDMILVRLKGVLTPSEKRLCESQNNRSQYLLKQVRNELLNAGRPTLEALIRDIVGVEVQSVHTDISTKTGERIIVLTLQQRPDLQVLRLDRSNASKNSARALESAERGRVATQFDHDQVRVRTPLRFSSGGVRNERNWTRPGMRWFGTPVVHTNIPNFLAKSMTPVLTLGGISMPARSGQQSF